MSQHSISFVNGLMYMSFSGEILGYMKRRYIGPHKPATHNTKGALVKCKHCCLSFTSYFLLFEHPLALAKLGLNKNVAGEYGANLTYAGSVEDCHAFTLVLLLALQYAETDFEAGCSKKVSDVLMNLVETIQ